MSHHGNLGQTGKNVRFVIEQPRSFKEVRPPPPNRLNELGLSIRQKMLKSVVDPTLRRALGWIPHIVILNWLCETMRTLTAPNLW